MAFTLDQYNKLIEAISLGARSVMYGNKTVTYNSPDEMLRLKEKMEIDLGLKSASSKKVLTTFNKGLC